MAKQKTKGKAPSNTAAKNSAVNVLAKPAPVAETKAPIPVQPALALSSAPAQPAAPKAVAAAPAPVKPAAPALSAVPASTSPSTPASSVKESSMNAPAATTQEKPAATSQAQEISTKAAAPAPSVPRLVANATEKQETKAAKPTKEAPRSASLQDETQQVLAAVSTSCETVFCAGAEAIAQVTSNYTDQLNTAQERISAMSNEALEHVSRSTDSALKQFNDAISSSQQSAEAITNIFQNSGNNFNKMSEELFNFANQCFARNIELSRDILSCRTINDAIELQNKMMQTNVDDVMEEMAKLTEMFFEAAAAAVDPLGETITNAVDRLSKTIAA